MLRDLVPAHLPPSPEVLVEFSRCKEAKRGCLEGTERGKEKETHVCKELTLPPYNTLINPRISPVM